MFKLISICALVAVFSRILNAAETEKNRVTNIGCDFNTEYVGTNASCNLKLLRNRTRLFTIKLYIIKEIRQMMINIALFRKANGYKPGFVNITQDICDFFRGKASNPFAKIVAQKWIKPSMTAPVTCPLYGLIEIRDVNANIKDVPSVIPSGDYMIRAFCFIDKPFVQIADIKVYTEINSVSFLTM